jgi:hypothetical protein
MKYYAGIGSRETPPVVCDRMTAIAEVLEFLGYTLRSGGADGADMAFEKGVLAHKEIWLPWRGFNNNQSLFFVPESINKMGFQNKEWEEIRRVAKYYHPAWERLSQGGQRLMMRNVCQVLGIDLNTPVDFIICWTKDGKASGGTGQALRIAKEYDIPIKYLYEYF